METSCPYITSANIASQGNGFALFAVTWQYTPLNEQAILVQYRVQGDITWINVSTSQKVDVFGNLTTVSLTILANAVSNTIYEIRLVNQCGSLEFITTYGTAQKVYSNSYLVDNFIYNICGTDPVTLYSKAAFAVGVFMYTDVGFATPLTGYLFIALNGVIYNIDTGTGEVGAVTAYTCVPFSIQVQLDNYSTNVCSATPTIVYSTVAEPGIGNTLYLNGALNVPVTGFDYLVIAGSPVRYNINTATGAIVSLQGGSCAGINAYYLYSQIMDDIDDKTPTLLYSLSPFGTGAAMKTDVAVSAALTGYNYIKQQGGNDIFSISTTTGIVGCKAVEC